MVSTVSRDQFDAAALKDGAVDLSWLERVAREHDWVVQALSALTTVVPLRLGTIYHDDESALRSLTGLRTTALATLDVLTGRQEWGVKVYAVPAKPMSEVGSVARPASGMDYLQQRREALEGKKREAQATGADADAVFERLRDMAVMARRHRPQDPTLSGVKHPMLLNAAYLVDRERATQFRSAVEALADERPAGGRAHRAVAGLLLRDPGRRMTETLNRAPDTGRTSLVDLLDRVLATGVVLTGDVTLCLAGVDLVTVKLRALIGSVREDADV